MTAVRGKEHGHLIGISSNDDNETVPSVFNQLDDGIDRLASKVAIGTPSERIGLIDEQYTLVGSIKRCGDQRSCLTDETSDEGGSVALDELAARYDTHRSVDLSEKAGDGGFPRSRIASEN